MAWPTFKDSTISLILQALIIQTLASTSSQDKYSNTINRPISEIYSKNRENENSAQYRQNITSDQNINTRQFSNIPYNSNYIPGYNPYQYQQQANFGYPGGINFQGTNGFGYQGAGYPGPTAVGYPGGGLSGYPGLGNQGIDEKGLLFPLPVGQYPQISGFKPSFQQTNPFGVVPQGFGGFYPNYPVLPTQQVNYNQQQFQGQQNYFPTGNINQSPHNAFDIGSLPRQVRVPGVIQVNIIGKDAEIICEFPRYLLLVQGIYWHHRYDPFGSYFDTQNRFGPRITVQTVDQWKSVLRIVGYNEDDYGTYRCLSAAALPTDDKPIQFPGEFSTRTGQLPSTTPIYSSGNSQEYDSGESQTREDRVKKRKNARKMKFPPTRKLRFTRSDNENSLEQFEDDQVTSATDFPSSNEPYDPFISNRNQPGHLRNGYLDYNQQSANYNHNSFNNNNYRYPVTLSQNPFIPNLQTTRHLIPGFGNYPGFDIPTSTFANSQTPVGLQVPYYKPSYSIYTVFQETSFQPTGGLRSSSSSSVASTSANPLKPKTG